MEIIDGIQHCRPRSLQKGEPERLLQQQRKQDEEEKNGKRRGRETSNTNSNTLNRQERTIYVNSFSGGKQQLK